MKPTLLSIAFTLIYTFAFREATKRAADWGAFQFPSGIKGMLLKAFISGIILVGIPVLFYALSLKVISQHISTNESFLDLLWMILLITLLGFFPRAAKNLWSLVAHCRVAKGRGEGWLLTDIELDRDLPHRSFSLQVVGLLGIVPVVLLWFGSEQVSFNLKEVVLQLLVLIYLSEMIVLHHRAKALNYFYPDPRPKNLLARRTIPSVFVSILLPIIFAIFCSPWVLWLQEEAHGWDFWVGVVLSLPGLGFPLYCNNYLLGVAKEHNWIDPPSLELKGPTWLWKLAGVPIVAFALVTLPYCDTYTKKYGEVSNLAQTSVKKLNEGNVPPRP